MPSNFQRDYIAASLAEYSPGENFVVGPNSAELQLALLACGAAGESFRQIARALGTDAETADDLLGSNYTTNLLRRREDLNRSGDKDDTLVCSRTGFVSVEHIQPTFARHLERFGATPLFSVNVRDLMKKVNAWAARATATPSTPGGLINPLIKQPLDPLIQFVVLTADAFELTFFSPFEPEMTREAPFGSGDGAREIADMMGKTFYEGDRAIWFEKRDGTQGAVLSYGSSGDFSLRVTKVPAGVASGLQPIAEWFRIQAASPTQQKSTWFSLSMPRADILGQRDAAATHARLGIHAIYCDQAELSGILSSGTMGNVRLSQSIEASSLKINEIKTEGAVVQAAIAVGAAIAPKPPKLVLDSTYLVEVVVGDGEPSANKAEDVLLFAVVNKPGRLRPPAIEIGLD